MNQARQNRKRLPRCNVLLLAALLLLITFQSGLAQDLPKKIRGYKVYDPGVSVGTDGSGRKRVDVEFGAPEFSSVGLDGITFQIPGQLTVFGQKGRVDFLAFHDFKVNGLPVEIGEYSESFEFEDGVPHNLAEPVEISVGFASAGKGVLKEFAGPEDEWEVAGTVFVFGRYKWSLFSFKRVVPVKVSFRIPNPVKKRKDQVDEESATESSEATAALFTRSEMFAFNVRPSLSSLSLERRNGVTSLPVILFE